MPAALTDEQLDNYRHDGFVAPIRVLSAQHAADYRAHFEAYEKANGGWHELSKGQKLYLRQIEAPKDSAWLLRGEDATGNWIHETPPNADMNAAALREHERIMKLRQGVLYKNVSGQPAHIKLQQPEG